MTLNELVEKLVSGLSSVGGNVEFQTDCPGCTEVKGASLQVNVVAEDGKNLGQLMVLIRE